ncbi:6-phosphogluconolactonase [Flavobacterium rivuli WB 3.3-2 = DSM 21788]|uniref:6-phosphogluconolactonase n=1 Tax=Flavobacterium rivuli WB 3.3-2 = DSM 21788 TaxID=1121895 RepID=A0A0A2LY43_9FLAO|nr:lactonase family protein [Flavobacterium rivuli]KGO84924.1 6-phosphogluconolactonase [Flavobacterium rivuli WB 3.3-2 = DSM 21788]
MIKKLSPLFFILFTINTFAQNTYVFFGSYNQNQVKEGIYVYQLDTVSGRLSKITSVKVGNPSYLTVTPNGFIYACTNTKTPNEGSVSAYKFNPTTKSLTFMNRQESGGENPVYVTVDASEKWIINANYTDAGVSVHHLNQDGSIGAMVQNFKFTEGSINPERQTGAHIHSAVFAPDFKYIFFPDLGADKIRAYTFNETAASEPLQNTASTYIPTTPGGGPRHFTFHPNGKFAYCIEEMGGAVSAYVYKNGGLDSLQRIYTHPETVTGGFESSDIHISPDGKFLYASNRGKENNIAIFSIGENGTLKPVGYQSTLGNHPRIFAIDPSGKFLIVTNVNSSNVIVFRRDAITGLLIKTGKEITIKNVSCVQITKY